MWSHSGELYLRSDTTVDLSMEKLPNAIEIRGPEGSFRIWPNPTSSILQLELPAYQTALVTIHDARGSKLLETKASGPVFRIDLGPYPAGVYSIAVDGASPSLILKL